MLDSDLPSASFVFPPIWNFHSIFHVEIPFLTKSVRPARCMEGKTCFFHMYTDTAPYCVTHTESPQGFYSPVLLPGTLHTYSWDREWSSSGPLFLEPCSWLLTASESWGFAAFWFLWSGWLLITLPTTHRICHLLHHPQTLCDPSDCF